ncbi:septal ring lytic transglycosylase RlpA family protein [Chroococcus sp. FPU101]|uniref:septal ring lytic transglycosylase RlpA family protein n=1 Tax=Chroococcus sp. FPU101 TaxID=1974212 RepID=UPI001A8C88FC|nr:septal ring lytic transglycosylase RlpA family protein [Chroococcus sp. FPU101]GFE71973.1 RlpA-like lipoprotein precursor [Chroococcus sp. FPU101]
MKRKIWNQLTEAVLIKAVCITAIGTAISIVSSAEVSFGSSLTDVVVQEQSNTEALTPQSTTENQSTTVDTRNNFAPSQSEIFKPNGLEKPVLENQALENPIINQTSLAVPEPKMPTLPMTNAPVPPTQSQSEKAAITRPISNNNAAPAKKTQPKKINQTTSTSKPTAKVSKSSQTAQQAKGRVVTRRKQGMASWYGPGFHGRRTANGERFNQYGMTAAHRTLPIGTQVRVTNLNNGRSVVVRINDRGPFGKGRIIDLSKGAARLIGVVQSGVAPVLLEVLGR